MLVEMATGAAPGRHLQKIHNKVKAISQSEDMELKNHYQSVPRGTDRGVPVTHFLK